MRGTERRRKKREEARIHTHVLCICMEREREEWPKVGQTGVQGPPVHEMPPKAR